eukprot:426975_1
MLSLHLLVAHWCFILISSQNSPTNINDKCESSDEIPDARTIQAHHSIRFVLNDTFHHLPRSNQSQPIIILDKCNKIVYIMRINNKKIDLLLFEVMRFNAQDVYAIQSYVYPNVFGYLCGHCGNGDQILLC